MSRWIETELKLLLPDASAWRRVRDALGPGPVVVQENHFFDLRDGTLAAARIAVRLRAANGRRQLTVKGGELGTRAETVSRRIELEVDMKPDELEAALAEGLDLAAWLPRLESRATPPDARPPELLRLLDALRSASRRGRLVRIDGLRNRRERLRLALADELGAIELTLELDETRFPDHDRTDYEIEVELGGELGGNLNAEPEPAPDEAGRLDPRRVERALLHWLRTLGIHEVARAPSKLARLRAPARLSD